MFVIEPSGALKFQLYYIASAGASFCHSATAAEHLMSMKNLETDRPTDKEKVSYKLN